MPCIDAKQTNYPSSMFLNRELSWLEFNYRVMQEARNERHPLLERVKFLAIYASNLNEFYMIRVSGLRRQLAKGAFQKPPDGMSPAEQLAGIHERVTAQLTEYTHIWQAELLPQLAAEGIRVRQHAELSDSERARVDSYFRKMVFPILTPMAFDPTRPFPHISNLSVNLAVVVQDSQGGERFARLKIPGGLPRLLPCSDQTEFVWLEDLIANNLDILFPGYTVVSATPFRVTRDADIELDDDEVSDLRTLMQEQVELRQFGGVVRLEIDSAAPTAVCEILVKNLKLRTDQVTRAAYPLGMTSLWELMEIGRPDLLYPPIVPRRLRVLSPTGSLLDDFERRDAFLYHPYDSFQPVEGFVWEAANDPDVLAIKQTLYRVGDEPDLIKALVHARSLGKQVTVLVELRARFDEANNITWAQELEKAGVHVIYGLVGLKVHAKMTLVLRRRGDALASCVHLGTGNYNPQTARLYTDFGLFTSDPDICADVLQLFNSLTGYADFQSYRKLLVAPERLRQNVIALIEAETASHKAHGDGRIALKLNSLVDRDCIEALYNASRAGVRVDLQVRGICCLRQGVPGVSDCITVTSVVGRFLEHSRAFYFRNGGQPKLYLGSADLMPRNLERRVETLFPVENERIKLHIIQEILEVHLADNVQAWMLHADGHYIKAKKKEREPEVDSQRIMMQNEWHS